MNKEPVAKKAKIRELLLSQQNELNVKLGRGRLLSHPTAQGDATELDWRAVIDAFLPNRYCVDKAFVVDSDDEISEQIDAVIFDRQYCPLWLVEGGYHYIPAESVYAVLEVRQQLSAENIAYARDKAESVRRLHRTNAPIVHAGGRVNKPKPPFNILAGILTLDSSWSPSFGDAFEAALANTDPVRRLDIGCALRAGAFDLYTADELRAIAEAAEQDDPAELVGLAGDQAIIHRSEQDAALMFFLMRLFRRLQGLGTVPAIDLDAYSRAIRQA